MRIETQIADALDRAHRTGVIHRDLKPGNVMLTRAGAKLMDFGLARATGLAGPSGSGVSMGAALSQSPTMAAPLTAEGTLVGTFQYMAPEQLDGPGTGSTCWSAVARTGARWRGTLWRITVADGKAEPVLPPRRP